MKTLLDIFFKIFQKKYIKHHIIAIIGIVFFIFLRQQGYISFSTKDNNIARNTMLRDMFHQNRSQHHLDEANKNWAEKFFNISFD